MFGRKNFCKIKNKDKMMMQDVKNLKLSNSPLENKNLSYDRK